MVFFLFCSCREDFFQESGFEIAKIPTSDNLPAAPEKPSFLEKKISYPWETQTIRKVSKITSEDFVCKGSYLNPERNGIKDCVGGKRHSLPLVAGKRAVYPILVNLLNYVQKKLNRAVIITCGHRCMDHNSYADESNYDRFSKHMIGAEVDFFVDGYEENPAAVIDTIVQYFQENHWYHSKPEYQNFSKYLGKTNVATTPICNKEILIKLYQSHEGRDFDNRHPYPYIGIQVRFDKNLSQSVEFTREVALAIDGMI